jgi:antitoxin (DNA-binding transcriptional repressor) of toxin-antitoxin stability system
MRTFNILQAKTGLLWLVERAAKGETFLIAVNGKPLVKVTALDTSSAAPARRLGFLAGEISFPEGFDRMSDKEIEHLFAHGP